MASKQLHRITVTLTPELHEQLMAACKEADLPIVYWVRQAIRAKLDAQAT